jgi:hypothetical protein
MIFARAFGTQAFSQMPARKTSQHRRPKASWWLTRVMDSAARLKEVILHSMSIVKTPSLIESKIVFSRPSNFLMDQVPGAARCFFNHKLGLDQLHFGRSLRDIPKQPETVSDVMQPEEFLSGDRNPGLRFLEALSSAKVDKGSRAIGRGLFLFVFLSFRPAGRRDSRERAPDNSQGFSALPCDYTLPILAAPASRRHRSQPCGNIAGLDAFAPSIPGRIAVSSLSPSRPAA